MNPLQALEAAIKTNPFLKVILGALGVFAVLAIILSWGVIDLKEKTTWIIVGGILLLGFFILVLNAIAKPSDGLELILRRALLIVFVLLIISAMVLAVTVSIGCWPEHLAKTLGLCPNDRTIVQADSSAQDSTGVSTHVFYGFVDDSTGKSIENALVYVRGKKLEEGVHTTTTGSFSFDVPAGCSTVDYTVAKDSFITHPWTTIPMERETKVHVTLRSRKARPVVNDADLIVTPLKGQWSGDFYDEHNEKRGWQRYLIELNPWSNESVKVRIIDEVDPKPRWYTFTVDPNLDLWLNNGDYVQVGTYDRAQDKITFRVLIKGQPKGEIILSRAPK